MKYTEKLQLKKPDLTDYVNISDINENMDVLDTAVKELQDGSTEIEDLQTNDKTLAGAINELKENIVTHLADMNIHNQFLNGDNKKMQVTLGWNDALNCATMEYKEVSK